MTLKKFFIYVVIIIAVYKVVGIIEENDKAKNPPKKSEPIVYFKDEKAVKEILSKEKKIKDFNLEFQGWVYVGMYSDGTRRDGYAGSLCLTLMPYLAHEITVKIVDYKDVLQKKGFTEMGIARCDPIKQKVR